VDRDDGLELRDAWVTAVARCAPPGNKPTRAEITTCRGFLLAELRLLPRVRVVVALGAVAHAGVLDALGAGGVSIPRPKPRFAHAAVHRLSDAIVLVDSYHPSQQNTYTKRLTAPMLDEVFATARKYANERGCSEPT